MNSYGKESRYVQATAIKQVGRKQPPSQVADVWLGGENQLDNDGKTFVTLEIQPAWGNTASIRLSPDELAQLGHMIANRLNDPEPGTPQGPSPVTVIVPEGTQVGIKYT